MCGGEGSIPNISPPRYCAPDDSVRSPCIEFEITMGGGSNTIVATKRPIWHVRLSMRVSLGWQKKKKKTTTTRVVVGGARRPEEPPKKSSVRCRSPAISTPFATVWRALATLVRYGFFVVNFFGKFFRFRGGFSKNRPSVCAERSFDRRRFDPPGRNRARYARTSTPARSRYELNYFYFLGKTVQKTVNPVLPYYYRLEARWKCLCSWPFIKEKNTADLLSRGCRSGSFRWT